jgi:hypothetical protein
MFFDFLGTTNAATSWTADGIERFLLLLKYLARSRGAFSLGGEALGDGSYKFIVYPEISTFSDNVLASYPILSDAPISIADQITMYLDCARDLVADVAFRALNMSILLRGGISYGPLYHSEGVVFGEAMVDAYHLESQVANFPRIVVSPRVLEIKSERDLLANKRCSLLEDEDGQSHLNYMSQILKDVREAERSDVFERASAHITSVVDRFEASPKLQAKWRWFLEHYLKYAGPR